MENKIEIKGQQNDPASKLKGTGMKKQKKHKESKYFEGGSEDKLLMKGGNKPLKTKNF
jgi:hypothetical protein